MSDPHDPNGTDEAALETFQRSVRQPRFQSVLLRSSRGAAGSSVVKIPSRFGLAGSKTCSAGLKPEGTSN